MDPPGHQETLRTAVVGRRVQLLAMPFHLFVDVAVSCRAVSMPRPVEHPLLQIPLRRQLVRRGGE